MLFPPKVLAVPCAPPLRRSDKLKPPAWQGDFMGEKMEMKCMANKSWWHTNNLHGVSCSIFATQLEMYWIYDYYAKDTKQFRTFLGLLSLLTIVHGQWCRFNLPQYPGLNWHRHGKPLVAKDNDRQTVGVHTYFSLCLFPGTCCIVLSWPYYPNWGPLLKSSPA